MFSNIGGKIKVLAVIITVVGILASVFAGAFLMSESYNDEMQLVGFMIMLIGSLISWVSSFVLYGYGEIIAQLMRSNDISTEILRKMNCCTTEEKPSEVSPVTPVVPTVQNTDWICACGNTNSADAKFCRYCGNAKN